MILLNPFATVVNNTLHIWETDVWSYPCYKSVSILLYRFIIHDCQWR